MSTNNKSKINQLLSLLPAGVVFQTKWLVEKGYSLDLQKRYRNSKWLTSIGIGAMIRANDEVKYEGAIYALQKQSGMNVHPGGRTALSLLGRTHYLEILENIKTVFGHSKEKLPTWFKEYNWGTKIDFHATEFLPINEGFTEIEVKGFSIKVSNPARALMECLYLAPKFQELIECYELIEGLNDLNPSQVQLLLEKCKSVKVKRLFLYMADKAGHEWFTHLKLESIDLGTGKRSIVKNGVYDSKYMITLPKELKEYDKANL
ncbi:MAG: type IV toxin-antitoxin system AbiEi family antitoxin [Bacteroidota bacterium]